MEIKDLDLKPQMEITLFTAADIVSLSGYPKDENETDMGPSYMFL